MMPAIRSRTVAALGRLPRKPESWKRNRDDVKRIVRVAAVSGGIGERADDLRELSDGSRPAMGHSERKGVGVLRALVNEMNVEAVDAGRELVELVETLLGGSPVELLAPVGDELLEIRQVRAVIPVRAGDLSGKSRARQALLQIGKDGIFDVNLERDDRFLAQGQSRARQDEHQH